MGAAQKLELISEADYLASEWESPVRRELVGGMIFTMPDGTNAHSIIGGNVLASLHQRLRGTNWRPFNSNTKVRLKLPDQVRFYYPDVIVVALPFAPNDVFHDRPAVIVEVSSRSTRRIDEGEKRDAYFTIASLEAYLIVDSGEPRVTVWRRGEEGFAATVYTGDDAVIELAGLNIELPLADIYEAVVFPPEAPDGEME